MKKTLVLVFALIPAAMAHADLNCSAAYATDQQIVDHGPVELQIKNLKLDVSNAIGGTNRNLSVSLLKPNGIKVFLAAQNTVLGSVELGEYKPGTQITLDVPNSNYDEYIRVICN